MKQFFSSLRSSIYDPVFYKDLLEKPFSYSFRYYLWLTLWGSVVATIIFSLLFIPRMMNFLGLLRAQVEESYPAELQISIRNGIASANVEEPYYIPLPDGLKDMKSSEADEGTASLEHLIAIRTKEAFNAEVFAGDHALAVLNNKTLAYYDDNGNITISELPSTTNISINKSVVVSFSNKIGPYLVAVPYIVGILFFLVAAIVIQAELVPLLLWALFIMLIGKMRGFPLPYAKAYQVGLHVVTVPLVISGMFALLSIKVPIPFFPTILFLVIFALNFRSTLYATHPTTSS